MTENSDPGTTVTINEAADLLGKHRTAILRKCTPDGFAGCFQEETKTGPSWRIPLKSLDLDPHQELAFLQKNGAVPAIVKQEKPADADKDIEIGAIDKMNRWQQETVMKRKVIIDSFKGRPHSEWKVTIADLKAKGNEFRKVSIGTIYRWIDAYDKHGITGLVPGYGNRAGSTAVPKEAEDIFDSLVLQDSAPSYYQAYMITLGYMRRMFPDRSIPHMSAFIRRHKKKYRQPYRDLARRGVAYYQRNWEYYIPRDATTIEAGKGWFSDHHQLDTIVNMPTVVTDKNGKVRLIMKQVRPWATVWRDIRSGKMLSWHLHAESPSSDHIFYAFYLAAIAFGLPDFIYIDNGKDYRCRDFSGCYKNLRPWDDASEAYAKSLMGLLAIDVVFATAYNAQAKSVERDFQKIIGQYGKFMLGYTGGNPAKRPESTRKACDRGELLTYKECSGLFDKYMAEIFNKTISHGKLLAGMCPDEAFEKYRKTMRTVSSDALKMCAMRTSKTMEIGRNGVNDTELGIGLRYFAEWMPALKGDMVYIRRDIRNYQECWIWRAQDNVFLGKATLAESISMRADTPLEKMALKTELARKRADLRDAKLAIKTDVKLNGQEIIESLVAGTAALNDDRGWNPDSDGIAIPVNYHLTEMDHAIAQENRMQKTGTYDMAELMPEPEKKNELYMFECEKPS
jgi:transposase